jgi:hypothetical protein
MMSAGTQVTDSCKTAYRIQRPNALQVCGIQLGWNLVNQTCTTFEVMLPYTMMRTGLKRTPFEQSISTGPHIHLMK